jgi:site-specific recombinase XerD
LAQRPTVHEAAIIASCTRRQAGIHTRSYREAAMGKSQPLRTSKNRARAEFFLEDYPMLFPLLEAAPHAERVGAIVKGEHGLPVRERSYRKWFRQFARAAGIPDEVWSMDSRAGAATEADATGADLKSIQDLLTHTTPRTTVRYIRSTGRRMRTLAKARAQLREGGDA